MSKNMKRIIFWTPRLLGVLFAIFISIFAFDVFGQGYTLWETTLALLIHLIPTGVILLIVVLSWRRAWIGGILLPTVGIFYLVAFQGQHWSAYLLIAGPLFLIGAFFLLNWLYRVELHLMAS
jgi:hypothetical protein